MLAHPDSQGKQMVSCAEGPQGSWGSFQQNWFLQQHLAARPLFDGGKMHPYDIPLVGT